jgi:hypothetical protein
VIVKVQFPLLDDEPGLPCLVYDHARERTGFIPFAKIPAGLQGELKVRLKLFCDAEWTPQGWALGALAADQDW